MNVWQKLVAMYYVARYKGQVKYPAGCLVGYALPHAWIGAPKYDYVSLAQALVSAGLNCTEIEGESEYYDVWDEKTKSEMKEFVTVMDAYGLKTVIDVIHGKGKRINDMGADQFQDIIRWMNSNLPTGSVVVNAVQEGVNSKAETFYGYVRSIWRGKNAINDSNGRTPYHPDFDYTMYHPANPSDKGPTGPDRRVVQDSDSPILYQWGYDDAGNVDVGAVCSWMEKSLRDGKSCMAYMYRQTKLNKSMVKELGAVAKRVFG